MEYWGPTKSEGNICVGLLMRKRKEKTLKKLDIKIHTQETLDENVRSYPLSDIQGASGQRWQRLPACGSSARAGLGHDGAGEAAAAATEGAGSSWHRRRDRRVIVGGMQLRQDYRLL